MTLYTESGALHPTPPFDFARSLDFLRIFMPMRGEQTFMTDSLTKAVSVGGRTIVFRVMSSGGVEEPQLTYTLYSAQPFDEAANRAAADRIAFFLSIDDDLRPFYAIAQDDPAFARIVERLYGYHQVKFLTPFENACWAVLSQRAPMEAAHRMKQALVERYGGGLEVEGWLYRAFPEPARLADVDVSALAALVGHERKAAYLRGVAEAFASVDETFLRAGNFDLVEAWLHGIKGLGPWSVLFVMVRGLGRMERVPVERALAAAVTNVYGPAMSLEKAQAVVARYGPYQGYWAHYLRAAMDFHSGTAIQ